MLQTFDIVMNEANVSYCAIYYLEGKVLTNKELLAPVLNKSVLMLLLTAEHICAISRLLIFPKGRLKIVWSEGPQSREPLYLALDPELFINQCVA